MTAKSHSGPWVSSLSDMAPIRTLVSSMVVSLMEVAEVFDRADLEVVMDPEPKGHPNETFGTTCLISVLLSPLLHTASVLRPFGSLGMLLVSVWSLLLAYCPAVRLFLYVNRGSHLYKCVCKALFE